MRHGSALILILSAASFMPSPATAEIVLEQSQRESAKSAYFSGDWKKSAELWTEFLTWNPDDREALRFRGDAYGKLGEFALALDDHQRVVRLHPDYGAAWTSFCWGRILAKDLGAARQPCEKAAEVQPDSMADAVNLGHVHLLLGDKKSAWIWYGKAIQLAKNGQELEEGPFDDFVLFLKRGWEEESVREAEAWFRKHGSDWLAREAPATVLNTEADSLEKANDYDRALPVREKQLAALAAIHGEGHPKLIAVREQLAFDRLMKVSFEIKAAADDERYGDALGLLETGFSELAKVVRTDNELFRGVSSVLSEEASWLTRKAFEQADALRSTGEDGRARNLYERIVALQKRVAAFDPSALGRLADAYGRLGRMDDAEGASLQLVSFREKDGAPDETLLRSARAGLTAVLRKQRSWQKIVDFWTPRLSLDPNDEYGLRARAVAFSELGRKEEALVDLGNSRRLQPTGVHAWNDRCHAYLLLSDFSEARAACDFAIELQDSSFEANLHQGHLHLLQGDLAQSKVWYEKALALASEESDIVSAFDLVDRYRPENRLIQESHVWFQREGQVHLSRRNQLRAIDAEVDKALEKNDYVRAIDRQERLLQMALQFYGEKHKTVADARKYLGHVLYQEKRYFEALGQYELALSTVNEIDGADSSNAAHHLHYVANTLRELDRNEEAIPVYQHAQGLLTRILGSDDTAVAGVIRNFAMALAAIGQHGDAEMLFRRALAIYERHHSPKAEVIASTLYDLGSSLSQQGRHDDAEPVHRRVLGIYEAIRDDSDFEVALSLSRLANCLNKLGRDDEAHPLLRRALAISEKALGADHRLTAKTRRSLAYSLLWSGKLDEAKPLFGSLIGIQDLEADAFNGLGHIALKENRLPEALAFFQKFLVAVEPLNDSFDKRVAFENLGKVFREIGNPEVAQKFFESALSELQKSPRANPDDLIWLHVQLGDVLASQSSDNARSYEQYRNALDLAKKKLGVDGYPDAEGLRKVATEYHWVINKAALVAEYLGHYEAAVKYWESVLDSKPEYLVGTTTYRSVLAEDHVGMHLAIRLPKLGKYQQATAIVDRLKDELSRQRRTEEIVAVERVWAGTLSMTGRAFEASSRLLALEDKVNRDCSNLEGYYRDLTAALEAAGRDRQALHYYRKWEATGCYSSQPIPMVLLIAPLLIRTSQWGELERLVGRAIEKLRLEYSSDPSVAGRLGAWLEYASLINDRAGNKTKASKLRDAALHVFSGDRHPVVEADHEPPERNIAELRAQLGGTRAFDSDVAHDIVIAAHSINGEIDVWHRSGKRLHSVKGQINLAKIISPNELLLGSPEGLLSRTRIDRPTSSVSVQAHMGSFQKMRLSPDRREVATTDGLVLKIWRLPDLKLINTFLMPRYVYDIVWAGRGQWIAGTSQSILRVSQKGVGAEVKFDDYVSVKAIPGSSRFIIYFLGDQMRTVEIWDANTLKPVRRVSLPEATWNVASGGERLAVVGRETGTLYVWEKLSSPQPVGRRLPAGARLVDTDDGAFIAHSDQKNGISTLALSSLNAGNPASTELHSLGDPVQGLSFSHDGRRLLFRTKSSVYAWNFAEGSAAVVTDREARTSALNRAELQSNDDTKHRSNSFSVRPDFDLNGNEISARHTLQNGQWGIEIDYWEGAGADKKWSHWIPDANRDGYVSRLRFDHSGQWIFAGIFVNSNDSKWKWMRLNAATGNREELFECSGCYFDFNLLPNGREAMLYTAYNDGSNSILRFDLSSLRYEIAAKNINHRGSWLGDFNFDADGKFMAPEGGDAKLLDLSNGASVVPLEDVEPSQSAKLSPDGRFLAIADDIGQIKIHDTRSGKRLLTLMKMPGDDWAAIDEEGRFDGSNGGNVEGLHWVVGMTPIALSQLKERYYEPGLVAKKLGFNADPLRSVSRLVAPKLFPKIEIADRGADGKRLAIKLSDQGGGIGKVRILVNGKEVAADARGAGFERQSREATIPLDLATLPLVPGQENTVEVVAWNGEGYLSSRGVRKIAVPNVAVEETPPTLYAVVAGVSSYANPSMRLVFSGKDAADMAQALRLAGKRLFGADKVDVRLFTDAEEAAPPTRENLRKAFKEVASQAKPTDLLVVYLAGHGVMSPGENSDYYYLTQEARSTDLADPGVRQQYGISSGELTEWIKAIPALKQVMVLDTCAAGGAVEKLTQGRSLSSDQIRALDRLKDRTGFHVLMGAAADKVSYESSQFGQGLLTYAILQGMKGAALREGEYVDVQTLFQHAADRVPQLAESIGGVQKPVIAAPRGASFDIGQLKTEDKMVIPLAAKRPMLLRAVFQDIRRPVDPLGIGRAVNLLLREEAGRPRQSRFVFVDSDELPGAYQVAGRYRRDGDMIEVTASVFRDDDEIASFAISSPAGERQQLVRRILDFALQHIESGGAQSRVLAEVK